MGNELRQFSKVMNLALTVTVEDELISTLALSKHSAVKLLHDSALYKFMTDIDIDIDLLPGLTLTRSRPQINISLRSRTRSNIAGLMSWETAKNVCFAQ